MRLLKDLLLEAAASTPNAVAVRCPERGPVSYAELDVLANRVAHVLARAGVAAGDRVGIFMPKSAAALAAMQGTLRLGAAYVPLDASSPLARVRTIASDCAVSALVGDGAHLAAFAGAATAPPPFLLALDDDARVLLEAAAVPPPAPPVPDPDSLAYILYTSGSTGVPKGVCISQANALAFIDWAKELLDVRPADVFANHAPFHFDLSVLDVYAAWSGGASVALVPEMALFSARPLVEFVAFHGVTIWYSVPSALGLMLDQGGLFERALPLRAVCCAGEPFPPRLLAALRRALPHARLLNLYGPTETNVCTFYEAPAEVDGETPVPIGAAASGDTVWALKDDGARARAGDVGELCVTGPSVMLGYWGRQPHSRGSPYRTGDRVKMRADGGFDYLGRRDRMVKLKGHRVELAEVEAALGQHPEIGEVAAVVVGSGMDAKLVAVAVPRTARRVPLLELKAHCAKLVPRYMLIERVVWVAALPRTPNGKLDRSAIAGTCA